MRPTLLMVLLLAAPAVAQERKPQPDREIVYKTTEQGPLKLHVFLPEEHAPTDKRPAIVFFFGGGWVGGSPSQFYPQSRHLAEQGMVAISAEYRIRSRHKTTPFECVADGKSAIRWVRSHAGELGIDPETLAAGGGSAGGHVAAATATVPGLDDPDDDTSVSAVPDALVLFNPVYDNGPEGYGHDRVQERWQEISPMHNIREGMPPAIVFLGTKDKLIPVETGRTFQQKMEEVGSHSELMLFDGAEHGFFNPGKRDGSAYRETVAAMDRFLTERGFLQAAE
ncbi:MAG: alpha/beta hydrolase [Maioricimonas sp. JB049]